jgi:DNA-binding response OmpR family regulator
MNRTRSIQRFGPGMGSQVYRPGPRHRIFRTAISSVEGSLKRKILVVDDEPDLVAYLTAFFEDHGFTVVAAGNGQEGMEKALAEHPDLITLDITMPEESGVRLFRSLQRDSSTAQIPVVIVTGISHEFKRFIETRRQVNPPAAYFEKPVDRDALLATINQLLAEAPQPAATESGGMI